MNPKVVLWNHSKIHFAAPLFKDLSTRIWIYKKTDILCFGFPSTADNFDLIFGP